MLYPDVHGCNQLVCCLWQQYHNSMAWNVVAHGSALLQRQSARCQCSVLQQQLSNLHSVQGSTCKNRNDRAHIHPCQCLCHLPHELSCRGLGSTTSCHQARQTALPSLLDEGEWPSALPHIPAALRARRLLPGPCAPSPQPVGSPFLIWSPHTNSSRPLLSFLLMSRRIRPTYTSSRVVASRGVGKRFLDLNRTQQHTQSAHRDAKSAQPCREKERVPTCAHAIETSGLGSSRWPPGRSSCRPPTWH